MKHLELACFGAFLVAGFAGTTALHSLLAHPGAAVLGGFGAAMLLFLVLPARLTEKRASWEPLGGYSA